MDAKKCDICGAYYTSIKSNIVGKIYCRLGTDSTWIDYCPKCVDKIQEVIDQRTDINDEGDSNDN